MIQSRRAAWALVLGVLLVLVGYVVWPSVQTFVLGLSASGLGRFFGGWRSAGVRGLGLSVAASAASVAGSGVIGTALAWAVYRYRFPLRRALQATAVLPLALPPLVGVLAFLFLYGESGILPRALGAALGLAGTPFGFEGVPAVVLVHTYVFYVYFYLFVGAALRDLDGSVLEAAADLGSGGSRTFRRVVLPLLRPALAGAGLLVFMVSMAAFTAPLLFAIDAPFLTLQIFTAKETGDLAYAATVSTVLTLVCLAVLVLIERDPRRSRSAAKGIGRAPAALTRGAGPRVAAALAPVALLLILAPIAIVVVLSFAAEGAWTTQILPPRYTLDNYRALAADPDVFAPIWNSVRMAALATAANVVFGVAAALAAAQRVVPGRALVRVLAALPFAIPGTVIALNLVVTFSTPSLWAGGQALVATFWILPLAYFVRHVPYVVRSTSAALDGFDERLAEASADLGAGPWTTFRRIVVPAILPGVLAGTLLTFVTALGEFVSSVMLYVYSNRPISVEVFGQLRLYDFGAAAAYSVLLMVLVGLSAWGLRALGGGRAAF